MADWLPRSTTAAAAMVGLAGSAAYMWANSDPEGLVVDQSVLSMQSRPHPDIPACRTSLSEDLVDDKKTLYDNLLTAVKKFGTSPYFGWRTSSETGFDNWLTYDEVLDRSTHVGAGLRYLGQKPSNDTLIGMFSKNRVEMMLTQYACYQHSMAIVPMYDTLGEEGIEHIVNQTKMQLIICDDEAKIKELLKSGSEKFPHVKQIVFMDAVSVETQQAVQEQKWEIMSFTEMEITGRKNPVQLQPAKPEDICVICYTSGTTGRPKGAMIEHRGLMHVAAAAMAVFPLSIGKELLEDGTESYLSYLPLAHMYEQVMMVGLTIYGTRIGFYSGDVKELLNDIKFMAPTIFASVPRLLNRVYDKVMAAVSQSAVKSWLFQTALQKKEEYFKRGIITKSTIWDKLVFKKVQDTLGGNVKLILTGAAPISPPVLRFLRLAFGAGVCEGYGQTECSAAMTLTLLGDQAVGEVGPPLACCTIKLADVPEMNYYASDNIGEVCCSGKLVFRGYLHDEVKTKEAIDSEGWLHTGDIGIWTDRGTLKIVDRKKNIFKLAQGEYVAPEKIENVYISCPLVGQCFIHGDSLKASLVAIVVPDADTLPAYAKSQLGLNISDMAELCADEKVKSAIMKGMSAAAKTFNLKGFEQTRDIYLSPEPFSVENDLLTPTFKLKRVQARKMYQDVIDDMYEHLQ